MKKIQRDLRRQFDFARIEPTRGGHYRLVLPNGRSVIAPSTPSDWRTLNNMRAMVKRKLRGAM